MKKTVLGVGVLLALQLLWLGHDLGWFRFAHFGPSKDSKVALGHITNVQNQVQRRQSDALYWDDAQAHQEIHAYDAILTLENATSTVKLNDGSEFDIAQNTLVIIEPTGGKEEELRLIVKRGEIVPKRAVRKIKVVKAEIKAPPPEAVSVASAVPGPPQAPPPPPVVENFEWSFPPNKWRLYTKAKSHSVDFKWSPKPSTFWIQDLKDMRAQKMDLLQASPTNSGENLPLDLGIGRYRVTASTPYRQAETRDIAVIAAPPINLIAPANHALIEDRKSVRFKWKANKKVARYIFEVSPDSGFSKEVFQQKTADHELNLDALPEGTYFWRVRGEDEAGFAIPESELAQVQFAKPQKLILTPLPIYPAENEELVEPMRAVAAADEPVLPAPVTTYHLLKPPPKAPSEKKLSWLWAGAGYNYVYYSQTLSSALSSVNYQSLKGPSLYAAAGHFWGSDFGGEITYHDAPGAVKGNEAITVSNGNYNWRTITVEALWRAKKGLMTIKNKVVNWGARLGIQQHYVPYMAVEADTGNVSINQNTLTMADAGLDLDLTSSKKLRWELMGRYQYPVATAASTGGSGFTIKSKFGFDGSLGAVYYLAPKLRTGLFWFGQWHNYDFVYTGSNTQNVGAQTLFYSNLELRLGTEF